MNFYDNFKELCAKNGISPSKVGEELGIGKSSVSAWKNKKSQPTYKTLQKIADYFGVTVNKLLYEETSDAKKEVVPVGTTSRDEQSDYIMRALSSMPKDMLDNIEEICRLYNNDPGTDNQKLVNAIRSLLDLNK